MNVPQVHEAYSVCLTLYNELNVHHFLCNFPNIASINVWPM